MGPERWLVPLPTYIHKHTPAVVTPCKASKSPSLPSSAMTSTTTTCRISAHHICSRECFCPGGAPGAQVTAKEAQLAAAKERSDDLAAELSAAKKELAGARRAMEELQSSTKSQLQVRRLAAVVSVGRRAA